MDVTTGISFWSWIWAALAILVSYLMIRFWQNAKAMKYFDEKNIPHPKPIPVFGNMLPMLESKTSIAEIILGLYRQFPGAKYYGFFEFSKPVYILRDPELIKSITVKNFDNFPDHQAIIDESVDPLMGGNLISMKSERWKEMRSIISPTFTSSKMKAMFELISECADNFTKYFQTLPQPLTFDMKDIFTRYTNDVIATAAFGISVDSLKNKENDFYMMGKNATTPTTLGNIKLFVFSWSPKLIKFLRLKLLPSKVSSFFCSLVKDTILTRERNGITRPDLIHQLMQARHKESNEKLTTEEITAQAFIFFLAGFDTSSTLMCFASHLLAVHQDVQDRLIAEIDAAFEEEGGKLSYEKVNHLQYLEMVLNESLRMYPPAIMTDRLNAHEFELPPANETAKPILVKPGTSVWIPIYAIHHEPEYFPDPEKFDPERFSPENKGNINPFAFLPFGAGPRNCPGNRFALMETKLVLCHVLRKFRIRTNAKTQIPLVLKKGFAITAENGFWLDLEPRTIAVS